MINDKLKNYLKLDKTKVDFEDAINDVRYSFENVCMTALVSHLMTNALPFIQIYLFADNEENMKLFYFLIALSAFKFLFMMAEYLNSNLSVRFVKLFLHKNYYEMGLSFRMTAVYSLFLNIIAYFPSAFIIRYLCEKLFVIDEKYSNYPNKINNYLNINFWTICILCFNRPLQNMIYGLKEHKRFLFSVTIKFITAILFCYVFSSNYKEWFYLDGIAYSNVLSELSCLIYLIIIQNYKNHFPQVWTGFNLELLSIENIFMFIKENDLSNRFLQFYTAHLREGLIFLNSILLFLLFDITQNNLENLTYLLISNLFICLFMDTSSFTKLKMLNIYNSQIELIIRSNLYSNLTSRLISEDAIKNINFMSKIKNTFVGSVILNITIYILIHFLFFIGIDVLITGNAWILSYPTVFSLSLNGIVYSTSIDLYNINSILENKLMFRDCTNAIAISTISTVLLSFSGSNNIFLLMITIHSGFYYLVFKFYNFLLYLDLRVFLLDKIIQGREIEMQLI